MPKKYKLNENYRSAHNLVEFTSRFAEEISQRLNELSVVVWQKENGTLSITRYFGANLIQPLANEVLSSNLSGTTCVVTQTNDEVLQVAGLLIPGGFSARIIQTNDGFSVYNMMEVRCFFEQCKVTDETVVIGDDVWQDAKSRLENYSAYVANVCENSVPSSDTGIISF